MNKLAQQLKRPEIQVYIMLALFFIGVVLYAVYGNKPKEHWITNDPQFTMRFPGEPKTKSGTYGNATNPLVKSTYYYQASDDEGNVYLDLSLDKESWRGNIDEVELRKYFENYIEANLIQNLKPESTPKEIIDSKRVTTYQGYPMIEADITIGTSLAANARVILVGHDIYHIKQTYVPPDSGRNVLLYADTFKLLLTQQLD